MYSLLAEAAGTSVRSDNASNAYARSFSREEEWLEAPADGSGAGSKKRRFASSGDVSIGGRDDVNSGDVAEKGSRDPGFVPAGRIDTGLIGNERQRHQWRQWRQFRRRHGAHIPDVREEITPNATPATTRANDCGGGENSGGTAGSHSLLSTKLTAGAAAGKDGEADVAAELSASAENELVVAERALGAAMSAIARETGGKEAAALLVLHVSSSGSLSNGDR